jgi:hypothetical protein
MFPHRNTHKYTGTSPEGKTHNRIDHFLIDRRRHSITSDVRSPRGTDCDTDHYMVVTKVRERLALSKRAARKIDMQRFSLKNLTKGKLKNSIILQSQTILQLWKT